MFSVRTSRIAKCAAVVAVLFTVLFPSQSLVCRNCLFHSVVDSALGVVHSNHGRCHSIEAGEHCQTCDNNGNSRSEGDSQENCPCEFLQADAVMTFAPHTVSNVNLELTAFSFTSHSHSDTLIRWIAGPEATLLSRPRSLPLVLRI